MGVPVEGLVHAVIRFRDHVYVNRGRAALFLLENEGRQNTMLP